MSERERIARIIDPGTWHNIDALYRMASASDRATKQLRSMWRQQAIELAAPSLAKADAILSRPEPSEAVVEAVARAMCEADGDDWFREGPDGLTEAYRPLVLAAIAAYETHRTSKSNGGSDGQA